VESAIGDVPARIDPGEKELQELVESTLGQVENGLKLVDSYVPVGKGVIDSLCVDSTGAPVVIEYKAVEGADEDAFIQALSYAAWVDQNPDTVARFINQKVPGLLKEDTPESSRIIIVAPSFTDRTRLAATMVDVDLTLKRYLCFEHEKVGRWAHLETVLSSRQTAYGAVPRVYTIESHFQGSYANMRPVFDALRARIEAFGGVTTYARKHYIAFKRRRVFAVVHVFASKVESGIRAVKSTENPRLEDASDWGWSWVTHHLTFADESEIDNEALEPIRDSYDWAG
jgi:hypothetical protein